MPPTRYAAGSPVRQRSLRDHNLALVLRLVAAAAAASTSAPAPAPAPASAVSRADVAAATGLTRATVSTLVDELIAGRLVAEVDPAPRPGAGAGRPAARLVLDTGHGPVGIGLDVHVDYLAVGVVDLAGRMFHHVVEPSDGRRRSAHDVLATGVRLVEETTSVMAAAGRQVGGLTVAVPGFVDRGGVARLAPNLGWRDIDVRAPFAAVAGLAGLDVHVDNEANLGALAELHVGGAADHASTGTSAGTSADRVNLVYVSGEVGIGAGIVLGGQLLRGSHGWAGELGHVTVDPAGAVCRCGARGCLEQVAGQDAILGGATVEAIVSLATAGDAAVLAALRRAGTALGVALAGTVNVLDVDTVVLGGNYHHLAPWLLGPVDAELHARVVTAQWSAVTVRRSRSGSAAAVLGAAGAVIRTIQDDPAGWLTRAAAAAHS